MTFASSMQHKIYWGPLKKPVEWSLKTFLAPWAYAESVVYHDSFWYPTHQKRVHGILHSDWGCLFQNWEKVAIPAGDFEAVGWESLGTDPVDIRRNGLGMLAKAFGILALCLKEAPEFAGIIIGQLRARGLLPPAAK